MISRSITPFVPWLRVKFPPWRIARLQTNILPWILPAAPWVGKAALQTLGYETVLEGVAERYHASEAAMEDRKKAGYF